MLVRRNVADQLYWLEVLEKLPVNTYDVHRPYHLDINYIATSGPPDVKFLGKDLSFFDKIIYIGTPVWEETNGDEVTFALAEFEATLIAIFALPGVSLFNASLASACNKLLQSSIPYCKGWERSGWRLPALHYSYHEGRMLKSLQPDPAQATTYILYLSRLDYFVWPGYKVTFNDQSRFLAIIGQMQQEMSRSALDLLVFQFFELAGNYYLFSHVQELPRTDTQRIAKLISPIL